MGKALNSTDFQKDTVLEADVAIVGSGAGGGTAAEVFAKAGLKVILIEEGPYKQAKDFHGVEREAYRDLFQNFITRKTLDGEVSILQGRAVGGGTLVNWCASFRLPEETLQTWKEEFGLPFSKESLAPHFEAIEKRYLISPWTETPNQNNQVLKDGCSSLGYKWGVIPRNVDNCIDSGQCGTGCPVGAKQSTMEVSIPSALAKDTDLLYHLRVDRIIYQGDKAVALEATPKDSLLQKPLPFKITIRAKKFVLAAGAIGTPGILLKSGTSDPYQRIGKRTFLHPVNFSVAHMPKIVNGHLGAPQSIYCDEFLWKEGKEIGFKIEAAPVMPGYLSAITGAIGSHHWSQMREFQYSSLFISLLRDGFSPNAPGGEVFLRGETPTLRYEITPFLREEFRKSFLAMGKIQLAAGAKRVFPLHSAFPEGFSTLEQLESGLKTVSMEKRMFSIGSAHIMGGAGMGKDPTRSVVDPTGRVHQYQNVYVMDGSLFPTSIGVNPQEAIFTFATIFASQLT